MEFGKFVNSTTDESFNSDEFNTLEEAIKDGHNEYDGSFFVGETYEPEVNLFAVADTFHETIIEQLCENDNEEILGDWADRWIDELQINEKLKAFIETKRSEILEFIKKEVPVSFYMVKDIQYIQNPVENEQH